MAAQIKMFLVVAAVFFDEDELRAVFGKIEAQEHSQLHPFHVYG